MPASSDQARARRASGPVARLLSFAGPAARLTYLGCALSVVHAVLEVAVLVCVWFVARDLVAVAPDWPRAQGLARYGWWALALALAALAVYFAALMCTHVAAFRAATEMRRAALAHLGRVPLGYFDEHASGELRRVIEGSSALTEGVLAHRLPDLAAALATPVAYLAVTLAVDPVLGLACAAPAALAAWLLARMMGFVGDRDAGYMTFMARYQDALQDMNKAAVEYVRGIPVVKVFQQTVDSFRTFKASVDAYARFATEYVRRCERPQIAQVVAINASFAVLVPVGILLAGAAGDFPSFLCDFLFFAVFSAITSSVMNKLMYATQTFTEAADAVRRIEGILEAPVMDAPADLGDLAGDGVRRAASARAAAACVTSAAAPSRRSAPAGRGGATAGEAPSAPQGRASRAGASAGAPEAASTPQPAGAPTPAIAFEHVGFTYPGASRPALTDVSLEVPTGATVALVGPSGGGKSTLASLVPRFRDVDAGRVLVGGADVRGIDPDELMARVSFVFQGERLFDATLRENVAAARPDACDDEVWAALRAARCDGVAARLPQGLDTLVGAGGAHLSGGEAQRVVLARAILKDAPVVVLDEATAFADPENEALIQAGLAHLMADKTVLLIAHRLSAVTGADLVAVVADGRVIERGTHAELLEQGGTYARMWRDYRTAARWRVGRGAMTSGPDVPSAPDVPTFVRDAREEANASEGPVAPPVAPSDPTPARASASEAPAQEGPVAPSIAPDVPSAPTPAPARGARGEASAHVGR